MGGVGVASRCFVSVVLSLGAGGSEGMFLTHVLIPRSRAFERQRCLEPCRLRLVRQPPPGSSLEKQRLSWVACFFCSVVTLSRFSSHNKTRLQVPLEDRFSLYHICDLRDLAVDLVNKCTMDPDADEYNGEDGQPWNVEPVFSVRFLTSNFVCRSTAVATAAAAPSCLARTAFRFSLARRVLATNPPPPSRFPV